MAIFKVNKGLEETLSNVPIKNGTVYFTTDKHNLYIDIDDARKQVNAEWATGLLGADGEELPTDQFVKIDDVIDVEHGGTGTTELEVGGVILGNGTFPVTVLKLPDGNFLVGGASGAEAKSAEQVRELLELYTKSELDDKFDKVMDFLHFDDTPTEGSKNPVTSQGIKSAIDAAATWDQIKEHPTKTSEFENDGDGASPFATQQYVNDKISNVYIYKGSKKTWEELEAVEEKVVGDTWNLEEEHDNHPAGTNWAWNGETWDPLAGSIDTSVFALKDSLAAIATSGKLADASEDASHRLVTDEEKNKWNAKAETTVASQEAAGLMSASDKAKLDSISEGANTYTLPPATAMTLGGIKVGDNLTADVDGKLSVSGVIPLTKGGTGGATAEAARKSLSVYSQDEVNTKVTAATSEAFEATLTASGWVQAGNTYTQKVTLASLTCGVSGKVSPVVDWITNQKEYSKILYAEATPKDGIVFTTKDKPTEEIQIRIMDYR